MKTIKTLAIFAAAAVATASATPAAAATSLVFFTLTGPTDGYSAKWQLPTFPTPDSFVADEGFAFHRVTGLFPGSTQNAAYLDFFSQANDGGLTISDADGSEVLISLLGRQLYTGSESAPTMRLGIYAMTDSNGTAGYKLTVADAFGAVPEPASWALMILGVGMIGGVMRARVRRATIRFA